MNILFLILTLSSLPLWATSTRDQREIFSMGSMLTVEVEAEEMAQINQFMIAAGKELRQFENKISTWDKNSQLSQFNKTKDSWVAFDPTIYRALKQSRKCAALTEEHFHPGMGSLIDAWGLRTKLIIPEEKIIQKILKDSSLKNLTFRDGDKKIKKSSTNFWFEEGAFAKGAGLDLMVEQARQNNIDNVFLNFSGQIFSLKKREVGIAHPEKRDKSVVQMFLENASMSTSAIGLQHFQFNGKIFGHILHPKTGRPLVHKNRSVTVIHQSALMADCLSTGLLVLSENKKQFKKWLEAHPEIQVIYLESVGRKLLVETSCNLKNKLKINLKETQVIELCKL